MEYEKPFVTDLGKISDHTWRTPGGREKGGGEVWHYDKFCEMSGCSSLTDPDCVDDPLCPSDEPAPHTD